MTLRPHPARWFELLVMRNELAAALDLLARSASVELQSHGEASAPILMPEVDEMLEAFDELEHRYRRFWPEARAHEGDERAEPRLMLQDAMERLRRWEAQARDVVDRLEHDFRDREDLRLLEDLFRQAGNVMPDLGGLGQAGPMLDSCLYRLASDEWPEPIPAGVITQRLATADGVFVLAVGLSERITELERRLQMQRARPVHLPADLPGAPADAEAAIGEKLRALGDEIEELNGSLALLHDEFDISDAIADARFVRWYVDNVPELSSTENFAWISGWTSEEDDQALLGRLADEDIKGLLRLSDPPPGLEPPLILRNPRWMRPFELFTGMLGVPSAGEADPTRIVAIVSPVMFGYMFGDVGQGAVLLVVGVILSRRYPALRLLIAGGAASIVFGFLFGSVFALETVIEPIWLHPMERPLLVFAVPLAGGAVLLLVGMVLDAAQAYWQHKGKFWWETGAGLVLSYLALLGSIWQRWLLLAALFGALWFVVGHGIVAKRRRLVAVGGAIAELLETLMQLLVNTISFVRVGAFALAHAGLSIAVVGISEVPDSLPGAIVVLVFGNLLIIGLEGLVVGIQTTRLVLFEFFVRFLRAGGRPFIPLAPADADPLDRQRRPS